MGLKKKAFYTTVVIENTFSSPLSRDVNHVCPDTGNGGVSVDRFSVQRGLAAKSADNKHT